MNKLLITLLMFLGMTAFGQQRNELKIMVLIPEEILLRPVPDPAAETAIMEALVSQGFRVVDIGQSERLQEREAVKNNLAGENMSSFLADLKARFQADVLITGEAFSEEDTVINDLFFFQARLEVKAIDLATGQIMFSDAFTGPGNNVTPAVAGKAALQNVGEMAGEALPTRLDDWLSGRGKVAARTYTIKVENASGFRQYNSIMDNLQVLPQVTSVASRQFDSVSGEIEVVYNGPIEDLAVYLEEWGLSITGLSAGEVRAAFGGATITSSPVTPLNDWTVMSGTWVGQGYQHNNGHTSSIRMTLYPSITNGLVGEIDYPSLNCGGILRYVSSEGSYLTVQEDLTYGQNSCVDNGSIRLAMLGSNSVDWKWYWPSQEEGAYSVLARQ